MCSSTPKHHEQRIRLQSKFARDNRLFRFANRAHYSELNNALLRKIKPAEHAFCINNKFHRIVVVWWGSPRACSDLPTVLQYRRVMRQFHGNTSTIAHIRHDKSSKLCFRWVSFSKYPLFSVRSHSRAHELWWSKVLKNMLINNVLYNAALCKLRRQRFTIAMMPDAVWHRWRRWRGVSAWVEPGTSRFIRIRIIQCWVCAVRLLEWPSNLKRASRLAGIRKSWT